MKSPGMILQVFPSIIKEIEGDLFIDVDWADALKLYTENFDKVVFACPISTITQDNPDSGLKNCRPINQLPQWASKLEVLPLPYAYKFHRFIYHKSSVRKILRDYIRKASYLEFSPSSLIGDWATLASTEAIKMKRPYVISGDIVYPERMRFSIQDQSKWKRYIKEYSSIKPFEKKYSTILKNAGLAFFQGQDVYDEYSPLPKVSHQIYHVTMTKEERISSSQLEHQITELKQGRALKICYAGRAGALKGPLDWIYALDAAIKSGVNLEATWIGDGSLLAEMQSLAQKLNITEHIQFTGFVSERKKLLKILSESDIFLFCHKTRESPRCLLEALGSGCALIGYEGVYPEGLVKTYGGGLFTPINDWEGLSQLLVNMNSDRIQLSQLIQNAYRSGELHDRDTAYMNRINLIKQFYSEGLDLT
ncbi:MAG: glycosyltransferase [Cyanobacteria bacterium P01_B01_bin.77]